MKPLALLAALALLVPASASAQASVDREIAELTQRVERLEGHRAVKKLQRAFGYYVDRGLWSEAADLFADGGTIEIGLDGVYVGRERIAEYLKRLQRDPFVELAVNQPLLPAVQAPEVFGDPLAPDVDPVEADLDRAVVGEQVGGVAPQPAVDVVAEGALEFLDRAVPFEPFDTACQLGDLAIGRGLRRRRGGDD